MKLNIVLSLLVYVAGIAINCLIAKQDNFVSIIISYSITFLGLIGCYFSFEKINGQTTLFFLTITLIPLFTLPNLSDDIYRFYWDGVLIKNGISPYSHLPSQLIQTDVIPEQL
ncbi:MAG TPA: hypothetical protein PKD85_06145, partial [Saprospiraceae bacterium]|nr:hypothetical protein [Saprospiraceae bacterium]